MKRTLFPLAAALFLPAAAACRAAEPATLAETLLASYEGIQTVSCSIRKDTAAQGKSVQMLSRVHYQKPDKIHVENVTPMKRRIIADGKTLFYSQEGMPRGFSRPISQLDEEWLTMLRSVPGSPMEHLMRLKGCPETNLVASADLPVRRGYFGKQKFVALSCDAMGRLCRIEVFKGPDMKEKTAQYDYSAFQKVAEGCWIPWVYKAFYLLGAIRAEETRRLDSLSVNRPIPAGLFDASAFMKGIEFTPEFENSVD